MQIWKPISGRIDFIVKGICILMAALSVYIVTNQIMNKESKCIALHVQWWCFGHFPLPLTR